ncbi:hypothetical protein [Serratia silvae]|uniref:EAL domain-containing protein n=1 Tax=Serratia silvae TaxID=2824122 RepID=A0ABT0KBL3_9GAMM|nr:hypothetical protein [Serratia silvae]MCL1029406.1 hypothetical protein [Serratia silvae]
MSITASKPRVAQQETSLTMSEDILLPVQVNQHGTLLAIELLCETVSDGIQPSVWWPPS